MASQTGAPPGYQWVEGSFVGGDGGYQLPGSWQPIPGYVEAPAPAANPLGGPDRSAASINSKFQMSAPLQAQLANLLTNPVSGYATNPNYLPSPAFGRFQFSGTAPVPRNAPQGWGRYPGVDGAPGNAPWLLGQTMPPPVWGNTGGRPPVVVPPPVTPPTVNWNPTRERTVPPPYIGGGGELRVPNTGGVGVTTPPATTPPATRGGTAPYNPGNVFTSPIQNVTGTSTVAQSTGRNYYNPSTFEHSVEALPAELQGAYIPPQYVGHALPAGAFKSLWPNSVGTDWVKTKPEGWSPSWRPTNTRG